MKAFALVVPFVAFAAFSAQPSAPRPSAQEAAEAVQRKYDTVHDFSADFTHSYQGGVLRKEATERGTVLIKKPGKMRWTYTSPEKKIFVSDGVKVYSYIPQDRQVIVSSMPPGDEAPTAVLFLAGKGNLTRDFLVSDTEVAGQPAGTRALKLEPKKKERDYDWLTLVVDDRQRIVMLVTVDAQGGRSTFSFSDLKENRGLSDKEFAFTIPRGVDVITQ
jgi:outer membrane lipoprotein carrier protein